MLPGRRRGAAAALGDSHVDGPLGRLAHALNGTYDQQVFTRRAVDLIAAHEPATPLYLYLAYHNVHGAVNVPSATLQV